MAVLTIAAALAVGSVTGCGDDDSPDAGPRDQAVEQLEAFGLTSEEARCVVDAVGPEAVVEAADLNAYAESEQYRTAAAACTDG